MGSRGGENVEEGWHEVGLELNGSEGEGLGNKIDVDEGMTKVNGREIGVSRIEEGGNIVELTEKGGWDSLTTT